MKLSEIKNALQELSSVTFILPNGKSVASHFHVTEIGSIQKHFIDCGGTERTENVINFQLFTANDYDHRLSASKLKSIIELSEEKLHLTDLEVEVEYQGETIGKYELDFDGSHFLLVSKKTDCLAKDKCGIPSSKPKMQLADMTAGSSNACAPGGGCC